MNKVSMGFKAVAMAGIGAVMVLLLVFGTLCEQEVERKDEHQVDRPATDDILTESIGLSSGENIGQEVTLTTDQADITTGFV